jgi:hypothetical protein
LTLARPSGRAQAEGVIRAVAVVVCLCALAVAVASGWASGPSKTAITACFEQRHVLVDPGASVYLPGAVVPRSRQLALSFVFVPEAVVPGLTALVALSPTNAAAVVARARIVRYVSSGRGVTPAVLRRAVQRHGTSVVFWLAGSHAYARRVATACLGPRTP